jgi:hypothetical protein
MVSRASIVSSCRWRFEPCALSRRQSEALLDRGSPKGRRGPGRSAIVIASETHGEATDVCARGPYRPCSRLARLGGFRLSGRSLRTLSCHRRTGCRVSPRESCPWASEKPVQRPHPRGVSPLSRVALSVPATLLKRDASGTPARRWLAGSRASLGQCNVLQKIRNQVKLVP